MYSLIARHAAFHRKPWYILAAQAVAFSSSTFTRFPPLPSQNDSLVWRQCRGTRFDGQRCTRKIKAEVLCTNESELYCHNHRLTFGTSATANHQQCNISLDDPLLDGWDRTLLYFHISFSVSLLEQEQKKISHRHTLYTEKKNSVDRPKYQKIETITDPTRNE